MKNSSTIRVAVVAILLVATVGTVGAGGNRRRNQRSVIRQDGRPRRVVVQQQPSRGSVENQQIVNALAIRLAEQQQLQQALAQLGLGQGFPYNFQQPGATNFGYGVQPYQSGTTGYVSGDDPFRRPAEQRQADLVERQQRTAERLLELQEEIAKANLDRIEEMRDKVPAGAGRSAVERPAPDVERRSAWVNAEESCAKCHNVDKASGGVVLDGSQRINEETLEKAINALVSGKMPQTLTGESVPLEGEQLQRALLNVAKLAQ